VASNRIELWGRLVNPPELRTTPGGTPLLRLQVECGAPGEELRLPVVMVGEAARATAAQLRSGQELRVAGRLRPVARSTNAGVARQSVEVLANEIRPAGD
jgi:single-stranded DNA-binding protein